MSKSQQYSHADAPTILIAGCGFVGEELARQLLADGWAVTGLTRTAASATELQDRLGGRVLAGNLADALNLRNTLGGQKFSVVVHSASSGRRGIEGYREVFHLGMQNLLDLLPEAFPIFTSSTSVYAQADGSTVNEESPAEPDRETGQVLRETEDAVLQAGGAVARLAGLYGPERCVLLKKFLSGEARIEDGGERVINQVHRHDAASALALLAREQPAGEIFNVADDTPLPQKETYRQMAQHFQRDLPPAGTVDRNRKRGVTSKRVSNAKLRDRGWEPRYPSLMRGLIDDQRIVPSIRALIKESQGEDREA